jgi:hypothetical protein
MTQLWSTFHRGEIISRHKASEKLVLPAFARLLAETCEMAVCCSHFIRTAFLKLSPSAQLTSEVDRSCLSRAAIL